MSSPENPPSYEGEIHALFQDLGDPLKVAEDLVKRWNLQLLSEQEQRSCAEFLVAAGFYSLLFEQVRTLAEKKLAIPWAALAEALGKANVDLSEGELGAIFTGAIAQDAVTSLVRSHALDNASPRFAILRNEVERIRKEDFAKRKDEILDKLQFLRANRLTEQEKQVLDEFQAIAPADPQVQRELESFDMRRAREILSRRVPVEESSAEDLSRRADRLTPEQEASKSLLVARTKELAKNDPRAAYDLALSLHFMDFHAEALDLLSVAPSSPSADWLRLELMIYARKFVDALSEASTLEARYASDPEAAFAITYARARALKGLGQVELATDLLRSLVRVRPSYKSAQSLLMDWGGGDE